MQQEDDGTSFGDLGENDHYGSPVHDDQVQDPEPHPAGERSREDAGEEHGPDRSRSGNPHDGARLKATIIHLSGLLGFYVTVLTLANVLAPLLLWSIWKSGATLIDEHGRQTLNFQLSMTIYAILSIPFLVVCMIGLIPLFLIAMAEIIFPIIAAMYAWKGDRYAYPLTLQLVG